MQNFYIDGTDAARSLVEGSDVACWLGMQNFYIDGTDAALSALTRDSHFAIFRAFTRYF
jgi:hypothetical protein